MESTSTVNAVYLDHAATTPLRPEVKAEMAELYQEGPLNPSPAHRFGRQAARRLTEARERVAASLGANPREVFFTRGGTEADNLAVTGRILAAREGGEPPLVAATTMEHSAVTRPVEMAHLLGGRGEFLPVGPDGVPLQGALEALLARRPHLLSMIWVNNETGVVAPVPKVASRCLEWGVPLHTDAVQAVGRIPVSMADHPGISLLTLSGHKLGAPAGTGALLMREGLPLSPILHGGGQERGLRPGTEDVAGAVGLACAVELAVAEEAKGEGSRLATLRDRLQERLLAGIPGLVVHGREGRRAPHILNVGVPGAPGEVFRAALDLEGVALSGGAACASGTDGESRVLRALHGPRKGLAILRFSLGRTTHAEEVDRAAEATLRVAARLAPTLRLQEVT